jgi:molybdopterin-guanine dinucleotide biosynthesis protein A
MPCIGLEHLQWSLERLAARPDCLGLMFRHPIDGHDQIEPFPFACRLDAALPISNYLAAGGRAMHGLLDEPGFVSEVAPDHWPASVWTNLNKPEELQKFLESID